MIFTGNIVSLNGKFLDKVKFSISTASVFHYNIADLFRLKVCLIGFDVIDHKSDFPEGGEEPFTQSDEDLFKKLLIDDGLLFRDVTFDEIHERA